MARYDESEKEQLPAVDPKSEGDKVIQVPIAVSIEEMFNIVNQKLDVLISKK